MKSSNGFSRWTPTSSGARDLDLPGHSYCDQSLPHLSQNANFPAQRLDDATYRHRPVMALADKSALVRQLNIRHRKIQDFAAVCRCKVGDPVSGAFEIGP